ncbi:MAG TPA: IS66 family transposase [Bacteroidales bacterium]|mgnify:CR=1 FL=1|nr:IS66 family transposase [Bacteroidales bacterium]
MPTPEEIIIDGQKQIIALLLEENKQLKQRVQAMEQKLDRFTTRKDSHNSSIPPSKDENRPKRTNSLREPSGKKPGGQPGHEGKTLEMTANPDQIIDHCSSFCPNCGGDVSHIPAEVVETRQVIDIPVIKQVVTEHRVYKYRCTCGHVFQSDFPLDVPWKVSYGKMLESLVGYFSVRQYLPFKRLQELMRDVFGVSISEGGIHCLLNRLADNGITAYEMIRQEVMNSPVIGTDETGMNVDGKKHWFWTWQNKVATYIAASSNRGRSTIDEHTEEISENAVLVHDCWRAHFQTPVGKHQLCTVHLIRELNYLEELYKLAWPVRFRVMLLEAERLKKRMVPKDYLYPVHGRSLLERELDSLLSEEIDPKYKQLVTFQKRIIRYRDHLFTFLYNHAVPSHNNDSEKAIRNVKVKQKVSGQFKTPTGAENFAILRSIIDTATKNKQDVLGALNVVAQYHRD